MPAGATGRGGGGGGSFNRAGRAFAEQAARAQAAVKAAREEEEARHKRELYLRGETDRLRMEKAKQIEKQADEARYHKDEAWGQF